MNKVLSQLMHASGLDKSPYLLLEFTLMFTIEDMPFHRDM
jgi:hypothetical protein